MIDRNKLKLLLDDKNIDWHKL